MNMIYYNTIVFQVFILLRVRIHKYFIIEPPSGFPTVESYIDKIDKMSE